QAREQEPWDGPAALVFSDGQLVGAKLDRNGLRPLRYTLTSDGLLVVGSEVGLTDLAGRRVAEPGRLGPGEMVLAGPLSGAIFRGMQLGGWHGLDKRVASVSASRLPPTGTVPPALTREPKRLAAALGWTEDQFRLLFEPLGLEGKEATWSMGDDTPPAFISGAHRPLWDYCKQRFAQVTNPPIDPLREEHVMSLAVYLGANPVLGYPVRNAGQLAILEAALSPPVPRIDLTFPASLGVDEALAALARVRREALKSARLRPGMVLLTDRGADQKRAALPALLALAAAW